MTSDAPVKDGSEEAPDGVPSDNPAQRRRMRLTIEVDYQVDEGREPDEICSIGASSRILNAFRSGGMHIPGAQIADLSVGGGFVPTDEEKP